MRQTVNIPIQLFCVVSTLGELTPVRFRYENEEHQIITIDISDVLSTKEKKIAGISEIIYTCTAAFEEEQQHMFNLKYNVSAHKWTFFELLS